MLRGAIDFTRLRAIVTLAAAIAIVIVAVNFAALSILGIAPLYRELPMGVEWAEETKGIVGGLRAAYQQNPHQKPFLLYLGQSTARQAIDPGLLTQNDGCDARVVGLCGYSGGMTQLQVLTGPVLRSHLRPCLVLLCIAPSWLVGRPTVQPPPSVNPVVALQQGNWGDAFQRALWWAWIYKNHDFLNYMVRDRMSRAREALGLIAAKDPWRDLEMLDYPEHATRKFLESQMRGYLYTKRFDQHQFDHDKEFQAEALTDVISGFRSAGSEVLIVLLPETALFRKLTPAGAPQFVREYVQRKFGATAPAFLDFRDQFPDDHFTDFIHMNRLGRKNFSIALGRALRDRPETAACRTGLKSPLATTPIVLGTAHQ